MAEIDVERLDQLIKDQTGFSVRPTGQTLEESRLNTNDLMLVMDGLGRFLVNLHGMQIALDGPINVESFNSSGMLTGRNASWYGFMRTFFLGQSASMEQEQIKERTTGQFITYLSPNNRERMNLLLRKRERVSLILEEHKDLMEIGCGSLLNGNIHCGSIVIRDGKFVGLNDWGQMLSGDPVDDLAYLSIMPGLDYWYPRISAEWQRLTRDPHLTEKFHLYRLFESYRKIFTRYLNHHYLNDYPEPLAIAEEELKYYNR